MAIDESVDQGIDENRTTKVRVSVKKTPALRFGRSRSRGRDGRTTVTQKPAKLAEPKPDSTSAPKPASASAPKPDSTSAAKPASASAPKPTPQPREPRTSLDPHTLRTLGIGCAAASGLFTILRVFIPGSGTGTAAVVAIGLVTGAQALACAVRLTSLRTEDGALLPPVRLSLALFPVYATLFLTLNAFNGLLPAGPLRAGFAIVNMVLGALVILTVIAAVTMRLARRD